MNHVRIGSQGPEILPSVQLHWIKVIRRHRWGGRRSGTTDVPDPLMSQILSCPSGCPLAQINMCSLQIMYAVTLFIKK